LIELTLYTRAGCHLCDEMKVGLAFLAWEPDIRLTEIEVGWEGELAEQYGHLLPVLEVAGQEICHYFLDEDRLREALAAAGRA
jgi:hypothetical protein